jgi:hypothetical protein
VWVPIHKASDGSFIANAVYLRLWVENLGNATAKNVEVYAKQLRRRRADSTWERVGAFPPMNLKWANFSGAVFFPRIAPGMGKHCDLAHIVEPAGREALNENVPGLPVTQCCLSFELVEAPNHRGHIVGPGEYELEVLAAADNVGPKKGRVRVTLKGPWYADEATMLRDGVGLSVE